jgi:hypothetical protein
METNAMKGVNKKACGFPRMNQHKKIVLHQERRIVFIKSKMNPNPDKAQAEFAKIMTAACVRRGFLEKLHAGINPVTKTGDYSDVKVIDAEGREIPWNEVSRIDQAEMKTLITGIVDRIHTFLSRTFLCSFKDQVFNRALERSALPWTENWDEPKYLPEFLMPVNREDRK